MVLCAAACLPFSTTAYGGSARDYLNAPVDAWLVMYNAGYVTSVTPEDGTDISSRTVSNAFLQSVVLRCKWLAGETRDYAGEWPSIEVSSKTGAGIGNLKKAIWARLFGGRGL